MKLPKRVNFFLSEEQYNYATKEAKKLGMTIGSYLRLLIEATKTETIINIK